MTGFRGLGPVLAAIFIVTALTAPAATAALLVTARDDAYTTLKDQQLSVSAPGVLANDTGTGRRAVKLTNPAHGTLTAFGSDGSFTYRPTASYTGSDTFTYEAQVLDLLGFILGRDEATVTITVSVPATPTPPPTPTPTPTATPTPRPSATPTATPTPKPTPSPTPIVSLPTLPLPTLTPLPTLIPTPIPTPRVTPTPTPRATATPSPEPSATPTASGRPGPGSSTPPGATPSPSNDATSTSTPGSATQDPGGGAGGIGGGDGATGLGAAPGDRFLLPALEQTGIDVIFDASFAGFSGIEWAVPAFVVGVPGLLLMIAVGAQAIVGIAWLPFVRRWLGGAGAIGVRGRLRH